jgi:hypothetical protein
MRINGLSILGIAFIGRGEMGMYEFSALKISLILGKTGNSSRNFHLLINGH